jgi:hypothetical protein
MAFELGDIERKLLRLALSPSAQGGEVSTSAVKLIELPAQAWSDELANRGRAREQWCYGGNRSRYFQA